MADWLEWNALRNENRTASTADLKAELRRGGTADAIANADAPLAREDQGADITEAASESAFSAIERRASACGDGPSAYPFSLTESSITAQARADRSAYVFLLLLTTVGVSSRLRGAQERTDVLFERVASAAAARYFGAPAREVVSFPFGFPRRKTAKAFPVALQQLCTALGEGQGPRGERPGLSDQKDATLDLVVWRHFSDSRSSQLIGFGQCAAGADFDTKLGEQDPVAFIGTWFSDAVVVTPTRLFFVPRQIERNDWFRIAKRAGVLFDRTRIVYYAQDLSDDLVDAFANWSATALKQSVRV